MLQGLPGDPTPCGRVVAHAHGYQAPVVIAGGGLVGLSTAAFLAGHGVPAVVVERLRGGSPLPRAAHFHLRTIEQLRSIGVEDDVKRQSEREFVPEGAIIAMDSLAGRKLADIVPGLNVGSTTCSARADGCTSPNPGWSGSSARHAVAAGSRVIEGSEVAAVEQDGDGVTVTVRDVDSGAELSLRAGYLVAADGAHSTVRDALGIPFDGRGVLLQQHHDLLHRRPVAADAGQADQRDLHQQPDVRRVLPARQGLPVGIPGRQHRRRPGDRPDADQRGVRHQRGAAGRVRAGRRGRPRPRGPDRRRRPLAGGADVARRFHDGRVLLAGDAAHVMPPNGGFGGNTGIQDAYDVAWKLALVIKGVAAPALLATYEPSGARSAG